MSALLIVIACILLNAALAAIEVAFISASKAEVKAYAGPEEVGVSRYLRLRATPERALSTIQVGITLVSIVSGAVGGAGAQQVLAPYLQAQFGMSTRGANVLAIGTVAVPLMLATVVVGELVPKALALRHPEFIALAGARWLYVLEQVFHPVVVLLTWMTTAMVARIPHEPFASGRQGLDRDTRRYYALDLLDLARRRVRDAMVPWSQTVRADVSTSPESVADLALSSGHTRVPVVRGREIVGVLHTKELLTFLAAGEHDWRALVRPAVEVGLDDPLLGVLRLLQARRSHMAVVMDGARASVGIVTLEDILEEVLGDLYDEDDDRAVERLLAARGKMRHAVLHGRRS